MKILRDKPDRKVFTNDVKLVIYCLSTSDEDRRGNLLCLMPLLFFLNYIVVRLLLFFVYVFVMSTSITSYKILVCILTKIENGNHLELFKLRIF